MKSAQALRVAFVAGTLRTGGAEKQLLHMARALDNAGVRAAVFSLGDADEPYARRLRESGIETWTAGRSVPRAVRLSRLFGALRRFQPDIIQASHFYVSLYAAIAGWALRRPVLGAVRSDLRVALESSRFLGRWLFRLPTAFVANSYAAMANARELGFDMARFNLVTNVVDSGRAGDLPQGPAACGRATALAVASLIRMKRLDRFVDALSQARVSCPLLTGEIVGDGPLAAELRARASDRGLDGDALKFSGLREEIDGLMASASFLCLTSNAEGAPNAVLEAMALARPVVAMDAGDVARLVEDGVTGFVVRQDDVAAFAERMVRLALDPDLRARMGRAGRERATRDFSTRTLAGQLVRVYRNIATSRGDQELAASLNRVRVH